MGLKVPGGVVAALDCRCHGDQLGLTRGAVMEEVVELVDDDETFGGAEGKVTSTVVVDRRPL